MGFTVVFYSGYSYFAFKPRTNKISNIPIRKAKNLPDRSEVWF